MQSNERPSSQQPQAVAPVVTHETLCVTERWDDPLRGSVRWWTLLSADRTASRGMTCGVAEIAPGRPDVVHPHQHAQAEVYHFLAGAGIVHIGDQQHEVSPGSTLFIPGDVRHGVRNIGQLPLRLFYVFAVDSFSEVQYVFPEPPLEPAQ